MSNRDDSFDSKNGENHNNNNSLSDENDSSLNDKNNFDNEFFDGGQSSLVNSLMNLQKPVYNKKDRVNH